MAPSFAQPPPPRHPPPPPRLQLLLLLLLVPWVGGAPAPVRYDQRQTGNVNVQVDLKDVEIYAILDESLLAGLGVSSPVACVGGGGVGEVGEGYRVSAGALCQAEIDDSDERSNSGPV